MNRSPHSRILCIALAALLVLPVGAPAFAADVSAQAIPTFTISGTGWGHGIGMSQYGAQGSALAGKSYSWILGHYYSGTTLGTVASKNVKVNLDAAANYSSSGNAGYTRASWRILPGQSGASLTINGTAKPATTYTFTASGSSIVVSASGQSNVTYTGTVTVAPSGGVPPLLQVVEGTGIYSRPNGKYRGTLTLTASSGKIKLLNVLPLDQYIYGVVPRESPASWEPEALKAQAVAARSYAYTSSGDLYCTTSSQAYQGYGAYSSTGAWIGEVASTNAAVDATKNMCVKSGSSVVRTYFFSQSGGHTANNEDVWVSGTPLSYVRGVPDPYEYLANPPYSPWPSSKEKVYTGLEVADKLRGLSGVPASPTWVTGVTFERAASGHVRYATFRFSNGASARISGDSTRSRLGLLSTHFYFSGFPIDRIQGQSRYDTAVQVARDAFPATAATVVVASGENYADALTGSGLAGAAHGPLLLTAQSFLPDAVEVALRGFAPTKVYVMGGSAAVSDAVVNAIKVAVPGATVERVAGKSRYETARLAAARVASIASPAKALLVSGTSWPDAASVSALAYAKAYPILLTPGDGLGEDAAAYLAAERPGETIVVGGTNAVAAAVETSAGLVAGGTTMRLSGRDRYATAAAVARYCITPTVGFTYDEVYMATGVVFADALTGGTLAGVVRKPLLLTHTDVCPDGTAAFLEERRTAIGQIHLFGGLAAISAEGWESIDAVMMR